MLNKRYILLTVMAVSLAAATSARPATGWKTWWGNVSVAKGRVALSSQAPVSPAETHSALLTSPPARSDEALSVGVTTEQQLRTGSAPNPWEVAWTMFRFRDLSDYYWFILKPDGWELGKKQGSDRQIFLATGVTPQLRIGRRDQIRIEPAGPRIRVSVDGAVVVDYVDPNPLPAGGSVGLYEEDSRVRFTDVSVTAVPNAG